MASARLEMTFLNGNGNRFTLSVQDPKPDLTPQEVQAAMEEIIHQNIFVVNGSDLVEVVGARLVTRDVAELF